MGMMIEGRWHTKEKLAESDGRFVRKASAFRNWITADGAAGPSGKGGFRAEPGRYHLYVSLACPWAHRTLIMRKLKGLEDLIGLSVVHWLLDENGWKFEDAPGTTADTVNHAARLSDVYLKADNAYTGRVSVPVLWDKAGGTIVSNESSEIIRMFNSAFDAADADTSHDFYPELLRGEIDAVNARIYETINNGVYRAGFATSQDAYNDAVVALFESLDWLEDRLSGQPYLAGKTITEADWRLFTTLVRFDAVYVGHFKCNIRRIADYPNLSGYLRALYQVPGIAATVDMDHIKQHYYRSHAHINPTGVVPAGPVLDLDAPHDRDRF